jgi:hypothetical protein
VHLLLQNYKPNSNVWGFAISVIFVVIVLYGPIITINAMVIIRDTIMDVGTQAKFKDLSNLPS